MVASANTKDDLFGFIDTDEAAWLDVNLIAGLNRVVDRAVVAANADAFGPNWKAVTSHVAAFRNHGPCAAQSWTHTNTTGLVAQGNNLPDPPEDGSRPGLAMLNTAASAAKGGAIGCGIGFFAVLQVGLGCAVGAGLGAIVGMANTEAASAVTAGMAHPTELGWQGVADALFPDFDAAFQRTFMPLPPTRTRQFSARENGDIVVRWDDRSSTETRYELEIFSLANTSVPTRSETTLPPNTTEYTFKPGKGFVGTARVQRVQLEVLLAVRRVVEDHEHQGRCADESLGAHVRQPDPCRGPSRHVRRVGLGPGRRRHRDTASS